MRGETIVFSPRALFMLFQSTPLMRGETQGGYENMRLCQFQSTPLMRGETVSTLSPLVVERDFNPLPSCEGRLDMDAIFVKFIQFQSTPLMRGETMAAWRGSSAETISIHSPHARGDSASLIYYAYGCISIHSPHARGDRLFRRGRQRKRYFNPLPSCEGRQFP